MYISRIKKDWSESVVKKCKGRSKCSLCATPGIPSVALDCDLMVKSKMFKTISLSHGKINDCFLIEDDGVPRVGIIEFKGYGYDESRAWEQLMSGRQVALKIISKYSFRRSPEDYLIIVARKHHASSKRILFRKFRRVGVGKCSILMAGCNDTFRDARKRLRDI